MANEIYTIGHSTQPVDGFVRNLLDHDITAVADVRSAPYSRRNPQFNQPVLRAKLAANSIRYVFLGDELGARSDDESCYVGDKVQYERLAKTTAFRSGISRILNGAEAYRIVLMCAEKEPLACHRTILVARNLAMLDWPVRHILIDGSVESHEAAMDRLASRLGIPGADLFRSHDQVIAEACDRQANLIAYDRKRHQTPRG